MSRILTPWRFTADQYQRMGETGILHEDEPVELMTPLDARAETYADPAQASSDTNRPKGVP